MTTTSPRTSTTRPRSTSNALFQSSELDHHPPSIDRHPSIISSATPTVFLVPIQPISPTTFDSIVRLIKQFSTLPLSELSLPSSSPPPSPSCNPSSTHLPPQLLLNFDSSAFFSPSSSYHGFLHPFQPHRKPFGIIGIIDCSLWGPSNDHPPPPNSQQSTRRPASHPPPTARTLSDALRSFEILLATHHPRTPVGRCLGFYPTESQPDDVEGLTLIPHVGDQTFYLQRLIAEFASDLIRSIHHLTLLTLCPPVNRAPVHLESRDSEALSPFDPLRFLSDPTTAPYHPHPITRTLARSHLLGKSSILASTQAARSQGSSTDRAHAE